MLQYYIQFKQFLITVAISRLSLFFTRLSRSQILNITLIKNVLFICYVSGFSSKYCSRIEEVL